MDALDSEPAAGARDRVRLIGLAAGPLLAAAVLALAPRTMTVDGATVAFDLAGRGTLALMAWMATWWLTEAIEISATALLPLAVLPLLTVGAAPGATPAARGAAAMSAAAAPYASPIIFLFMGGFLLALSMQRWGLDRRIALLVLRVVGDRPTHVVGGFMLVTAVLSAFVSNTATAAMMLPIALSVIALVDAGTGRAARDRLALCLMLAIAYAASIGGMATVIGSPPNGILVEFLRARIAEPYRRDVSFVQWLAVGLPVAAVLLPVCWLLLTRWLYAIPLERIAGGSALFRDAYRRLGPARPGEWATFVVFAITACAWMGRPLLEGVRIGGGYPLAGLTDTGIAVAAGLALFVIPVGRRPLTFALDWETASRMPWGVLVLFGGGLSLAGAVDRHGVGQFLAAHVPDLAALDAVPGLRVVALVLLVTTAVVFLTELTSNTATTATLVPVLAALGPGLGLHPFMLVVPATLAASCAFMMPVATPPNAIVFGFGHVTIPQMCRAGVWLNAAGIVVISGLTLVVVAAVAG